MTYNRNKIAFTVISCDSYSDIWDAYGQLHQKNWSDCPYDMYLASHYKAFDRYGFKPLLMGDDSSWSHGLLSIISSLKGMGYKYAFIAFDDLMLTKKVDTSFVEIAVKTFIKEDGQCLRFVPKKTPRCTKYNDLYGKMALKVPYRVTLGFTLWNLDALEQITVDGESAWQFEKNATERSFAFDKFFCTKKSTFIFLNLVIKRKLENVAYKKLQKQIPGIVIEREQKIVIKEKLMGIVLWVFLHWLPTKWQYFLYQNFSRPINL